jgi:hypothetical protein
MSEVTNEIPAVDIADSPTGAEIPMASPAVAEARQASIIPAPSAPSQSKVITSARKALGLNETPGKTVSGLVRQLKARVDETDTPLTQLQPKTSLGQLDETARSKAVKAESTPVQAAPEKKETAPVEQSKAEQKITVAGKEYSQKELETLLAEKEKDASPFDQNEEPAAEAPAQSQEDSEKEWLTNSVSKYAPTEDELDTILSGGKDAVELFASKLSNVELNARKWVQDTMNPILSEIYNKVAPVFEQHQLVRQYQFEANFQDKFPDLKPHQELVRSVDSAIRNTHPDWVAKANDSQLQDEIARQTRSIITKIAPAFQTQASQQVSAPIAQAMPTQPMVQKSSPKPPVGSVGGSAAPSKANAQKAMAMDIMNF